MPRLNPSSRDVPGPLVTTSGQVISGAGSSGQQVWIGSSDRSISAPRSTISWQAPDATVRGRIAMTVFSKGSISSASRQPPGGSGCFRKARVSPISRNCRGSRSMPQATRSTVPNRLTSTGIGIAAALVLLAIAAPPGVAQHRPVIGVLSPFVDADSTFLQDLREGLAERGLREGGDIAIEYRSAEGRIERLPELAGELVRLKVDLIVTASAPAIRYVQQTTTTIPIVMARVGDAVDQGFVKSLAHPGGNVTGISWLAPELSAKRLELMKQALPGMSRVGVLREA